MNPQARIIDKKLLSKYQQNVMDRRQFRNQVRSHTALLSRGCFNFAIYVFRFLSNSHFPYDHLSFTRFACLNDMRGFAYCAQPLPIDAC